MTRKLLIFFFLLTGSLAFVSEASAQYFPEPEQACVSSYGQTECGYGCLAAYGQVQCATHPDATCEAAYGQIACGFDCEAAYGEIECAQTPGGVCVAAYGEVTCFESDTETAPWSCVNFGAHTACGYGCIVSGEHIACAQEPTDSCRITHSGYIVCGPDPALAEPQCLSAYGQTVCGYGCVASYGTVACSSVPGGVCQAAYGEIVCSH